MTRTFCRHFAPDSDASQVIRQHAIPFTGDTRELDSLLDLIGDSSFVLIGEASHGTHEFYKTRIDLTRRLIDERGFTWWQPRPTGLIPGWSISTLKDVEKQRRRCRH